MTTVAVTGLGLVTALGRERDYRRRLVAGSSAVGPARRFDASPFRSRVVAEVSTPLPAGRPRRHGLLEIAWRDALADASLDSLPGRTLVVLVGQTPRLEESPDDADADDFAGPYPPELPGAPPTAERCFLSHACASAAFGIAYAADRLRAGGAEVAVVAGANALNLYEYASMDVVRALSPSAARPFDVRRDGIVVGEGGGAVVLEPVARAAARGVDVLAIVAGAACRIDTERGAQSDRVVIADCMTTALADAGVEEVGYVHAHATGTPQGDEAELLALADVGRELGWRETPVSSSKGAIGHLLHASAFPGVASGIAALRDGVAAGTVAATSVEQHPPARVVLEATRCEGAQTVLVNSFGFGGNNASLVLGRGSPETATTAWPETP